MFNKSNTTCKYTQKYRWQGYDVICLKVGLGLPRSAGNRLYHALFAERDSYILTQFRIPFLYLAMPELDCKV